MSKNKNNSDKSFLDDLKEPLNITDRQMTGIVDTYKQRCVNLLGERLDTQASDRTSKAMLLTGLAVGAVLLTGGVAPLGLVIAGGIWALGAIDGYKTSNKYKNEAENIFNNKDPVSGKSSDIIKDKEKKMLDTVKKIRGEKIGSLIFHTGCTIAAVCLGNIPMAFILSGEAVNDLKELRELKKSNFKLNSDDIKNGIGGEAPQSPKTETSQNVTAKTAVQPQPVPVTVTNGRGFSYSYKP